MVQSMSTPGKIQKKQRLNQSPPDAYAPPFIPEDEAVNTPARKALFESDTVPADEARASAVFTTLFGMVCAWNRDQIGRWARGSARTRRMP